MITRSFTGSHYLSSISKDSAVQMESNTTLGRVPNRLTIDMFMFSNPALGLNDLATSESEDEMGTYRNLSMSKCSLIFRQSKDVLKI